MTMVPVEGGKKSDYLCMFPRVGHHRTSVHSGYG